jgi:RNA polymerase sigma-70 factor, ECF subfamily
LACLRQSDLCAVIAAQAIGQAGDWRMVPLRANGQLAVAAYHLDDDAYRPSTIVVLATTPTYLTRISLFVEPTLFGCFGLPQVLSRRGGLETGS